MRKISELTLPERLVVLGNAGIAVSTMLVSIGVLLSMAAAGTLPNEVVPPIAVPQRNQTNPNNARAYFND